jgi:hypothetical protein
MFELHFDGINFGGARGSSADSEYDEYDEYDAHEAEDASRRSRGRRVFAVVAAVVVAAALRRGVAGRIRSRTSDEADVIVEDGDSDAPEPVTVD